MNDKSKESGKLLGVALFERRKEKSNCILDSTQGPSECE
jgi:hypothetical protein